MEEPAENKASFGLSRRNWIRWAVYGGLSSAAVYAYAIEPCQLVQRTLRLNPNPVCRIAHFSDLHFKAHSALYEKLLKMIAQLKPDFACFTGDLVENANSLEEGLTYIRQMPCPVFGVAGNHELWNGTLTQREAYRSAFAVTGGCWMENEEVEPVPGVRVYGLKREHWYAPPKPPKPFQRRILLSHYPEIVERVMGMRFDLILAGHSHGGQVRLPYVGAIIVPNRTGSYTRGLYETPAGPLNVSAGIGTYGLPLRFLCPPEMTLIEL